MSSLFIGSEININKALKLIRTKFPERAYPEFTLECVSSLLDGSPVISQLFKVNLLNSFFIFIYLCSYLQLFFLFSRN